MIHYPITMSVKFVQASYNMTLNEHRILQIALSMLKPGESRFPLMTITYGELFTILGKNEARKAKDNWYVLFRNSVEKLATREVKIREGEKEVSIPLFAEARYLPKDATIELKLHPKLKPYLLNQTENCITYNLSNVITFRGMHSFRIYQLMLLKDFICAPAEFMWMLKPGGVFWHSFPYIKKQVIKDINFDVEKVGDKVKLVFK